MAKTIGIVGGFVGKLGNTIGYNRQGQQLMRVYQPNVANPDTLRQRVSRETFRIAAELSRQAGLAPLIGFNKRRPTFERQAMTGLAVSKKAVSVTADKDGNLTSTVDYATLQMAEGSLPSIRSIGAPTSTAGQVTVNLQEGSIPPDAFYIDGVTPMNVLVFLAVLNREAGTIVAVAKTLTSPDSMQAGAMNISVPQSWSGERVHVYAFYKQSPTPLNGVPIQQIPPRIRFNGSNSVYVGEIEIG